MAILGCEHLESIKVGKNEAFGHKTHALSDDEVGAHATKIANKIGLDTKFLFVFFLIFVLKLW